MTTTAETTKPSGRIRFTRVLVAGLIALAASIIANLIVRWIGMLLVPVPADFIPLATIEPTIIFTTIFLVIATAIFALINQFARNPQRVWVIVAWIGLVISLIPDMMLLINPTAMLVGTVIPGAVLILMTMHLVGFAITMWVFTRWAPEA